MESRVSLGRKDDRTNVQILAEPGIEPVRGPCGQMAEILPTVATMRTPMVGIHLYFVCNSEPLGNIYDYQGEGRRASV